MLCDKPPNPIQNVKCSVTAETEDVMGGDILDLSGFLEEIKLWQNGNGLEKDGESPENLKSGEAEMEDKGEDSGAGDEVLDTERVVDLVVGVLVALLDEIDCVGGGGKKENLHDCVVEGERGMPGLGEEEVEITGAEDDHVEDLGLEGYAGAGMRGLDLEKEKEDRDDVEHVAAEAEDIHAGGGGISGTRLIGEGGGERGVRKSGGLTMVGVVSLLRMSCSRSEGEDKSGGCVCWTRK